MNKGDIGYLKNLKKREFLKCIIQWSLAFALLIVGYITTGTKLNLFTVIAVLGCLPASKSTVAVIVKWPIKPIIADKYEQIEAANTHLTTSYDAIITSKEKIMPVECLVFSGTTIYGFTTYKKAGMNEIATYIRSILQQNDCGRINVKIFDEFVPFLSRVEGLNNIASIEKNDTKEFEESAKHVIKLYSM